MMQPRIARSAARPSHRSRRLAFEALDARLALSIAPMAAHSDAHQHPEQRPPETFVAASWAGPVAPVATAVSAGGDKPRAEPKALLLEVDFAKGSAFGGDAGSINRTRRGIEKTLFQVTIATAFVYVALAIISSVVIG